MIKVTEDAMNHLTGISKANDNKVPVLGLRGGGCAGFSYEWKLKEETELDTKADHVILMDNGHKMAVDSSSIMFLFGTTLVLKQDLMGTMLEVVNPSASSSCGCGESINFDMDKVEANQAKAVQIPD
jgi:iron-sulfur cluster assembly protein|tara:strand:- start:31 stop:411 length:381 start_codon:yes stop_codon:yes gene_type:complete